MHARTRCILFGLAAALAGVCLGGLLTTHLERRNADSPKYGKCTSYIDTALSGWFVDAWGHDSLRVVPTDCGRRIGPEDTPYMFYELIKDFGDPDHLGSGPAPTDHWKNARGMANQLTCHLRIARDKPQWNIEPYRPWVGDDATGAANCNPYLP